MHYGVSASSLASTHWMPVAPSLLVTTKLFFLSQSSPVSVIFCSPSWFAGEPVEQGKGYKPQQSTKLVSHCSRGLSPFRRGCLRQDEEGLDHCGTLALDCETQSLGAFFQMGGGHISVPLVEGPGNHF